MSESKRIVWAVDAFSTIEAFNRNLAKTLKEWSKASNSTIHPVYVMSPEQTATPMGLFPILQSDLEEKARTNLKKILKGLKLTNCAEPVLLSSTDFSLKHSVKLLLDHAKEIKADLIAVGTFCKKGMERFFLGSFAETLILYSDIPVLSMNPRTAGQKKPKNLFFAVDLLGTDKSVVSKVISTAKEHQMQLVFYNNLEFLSAHTQTFITRSPLYQEFLASEKKSRAENLQKLVDQAKAQGVKAKSILECNPKSQSPSDSILKAAQKNKAHLIAIASHSGKLKTAFFGSVARDVVRRSNCPVWVIHPYIAPMALKSASAVNKQLVRI